MALPARMVQDHLVQQNFDFLDGIVSAGALTAFPTTGLYEGRRALVSQLSVVWEFVYLPSLDSTYPWHRIGGPPAVDEDAAAVSTALTTYQSLGGAGSPQLILPFAGVWDLVLSARGWASGAAIIPYTSVQLGGTGAIDGDAMQHGGNTLAANEPVPQTRLRRVTLTSASSTVEMRHRTTSGTGNWDTRSLTALPIRVS